MSRDALVVGINIYKCSRLPRLSLPSEDAEAIAQLLSHYGGFRVKRLPEFIEDDNSIRVDPKDTVTLKQLKKAIEQLFLPEGEQPPDTALLYFSGHGLRDDSQIKQGYLATSDVNPDDEKWGLSLKWLRQVLEASPIKRQIIWLDCCYSGELLNFKENLEKETDPGNQEKCDRCFITASRAFEVAFEETSGNHGVLTGALLRGLDPRERTYGWVTTHTLADFINRELQTETQRPLCHNSGNAILLTTNRPKKPVDPTQEGVCPYKGLEYFKEEDGHFFWGRTTLTDKLINKVRTGNFIAVLGPSGSGKSSVVRAGLLHQLRLGEKLSGSDRFSIYQPFTPGEHPLQSLKAAIGVPTLDKGRLFHSLEMHGELKSVDLSPNPSPCRRGEYEAPFPTREGGWGVRSSGNEAPTLDQEETGGIAEELEQFITNAEAERVVLVVDQFEECFTLCQDKQERQQFFDCLLDTLERPSNKLCLVLAMRADFLGKCAEYTRLANKIREENSLELVTPMSREELTEAIIKPAEQVGLEVEPELVRRMIEDVEDSPGSLPLLQYTLTELWEARQEPAMNWLTLPSYNELGGVKGTLEKRANQVYESLSKEEKPVAQRIFLELTQLGDVTDTRRRVCKQDLVNKQHNEALLDRAIAKLANARLITTDELKSKDSKPGDFIIDIAHEVLIRYWQQLREWVEKYRVPLEIERKIEAAAKEWESKGKLKEVGFLLQGARLIEAEDYLKNYLYLGFLDGLAQEYIEVSRKESDRIRQAEEERRQRELEQERRARKAAQMRNRVAAISVVALTGLAAFAGFQWYSAQKSATEAKRQSITTLTQASEASLLANQQLEALVSAVQAGRQLKNAISEPPPDLKQAAIATLQKAVYGVQERDRLEGHGQAIGSVSFSPDGTTIASADYNGTINLWSFDDRKVQTLKGHEGPVKSISFSSDSKTLASAGDGDIIKLWSFDNRKPKTLGKKSGWIISSASFSPDGKTIASDGPENTIKLWSLDGRELKTLGKHENGVTSVSFSPSGKTIVSADGGGTIKLWSLDGRQPITLKGHSGDDSVSVTLVEGKKTKDRAYVKSISFSPDGKIIASAGTDGTIKLWNENGTRRVTLGKHEAEVNSVSFSPDGKAIASADNKGTIKLWSLDGQELKTLRHNGSVNSISFSPDSPTLASAGEDGIIKLWSLEAQKLNTLKGHNDERKSVEYSATNSVSFSPDGKTLASAGRDNTIKLWSLDGRELKTFEVGDMVNSVSFSPDGKTIAFSCSNSPIYFLSLHSGELNTLKGSNGVGNVSFSPDGKTIIASAGIMDSTIKLWSLDGGEPKTLKGSNGAYSVSFSPDGKTIASANDDRTIKLWSLDGREPKTIRRYSSFVRSVSFSPDGKTLASAGDDGIIKLWSLDGRELNTLKGYQATVLSVSFSPDGKTLASAGDDATIILWNFDLDDLLVRGCDWLRDYLKNPNNGMPQNDPQRRICDDINSPRS